MSLIDAMMDKCVLMNQAKVADGEGGYITTWTEGAEIDVAITQDTSLQARVAEKQGVMNTYTLTTNKATALEYRDVIKRKKDGLIIRVTSDAKDFPDVASNTLRSYTQVNGERWTLT